jgi:hypothetical protein
MKLAKAVRDTLVAIHAATAQNASLFVDANSKEVKALVKAKLVETNAQLVGEGGKIAARTTAEGGAEAGKATTPVERAAPVRVTPPQGGFAILKASEVPEPPPSKRAGNRESVYPFDKLAAGEAVFIPVTETIPEPWNKLRGTVSSANKKFGADKIPVGERKKFTVFEGERNKQKGAFIKRIAYTAPTPTNATA